MTGRPIATYRLQLRPGFGFEEASALVPYLRALGVSHLYLSPVFAARGGSTHGYDIVDPTRISPNLEIAAKFRRLTAELRKYEMGLLLDVVPNHMAASDENRWWADVLERGQASPHARLFDVDWEEGDGRVIDWRAGLGMTNYRRFFALDDYVGVRVEDPEVFDVVHSLTLRLASHGDAHGLRIDHIDGLYDPLAYLRRLRSRIGRNAYVVVEKILSGDERLREEWPVQGTTGYEFLHLVNGLFVEPNGLSALKEAYRRFARRRGRFVDTVYERKRAAALEQFTPDFRRLGRRLKELADKDGGPHLSEDVWREALVEVSSSLPVYRTYTRSFSISPDDRRRIEQAVREARRHRPTLDRRALGFLRRVLLGEAPSRARGRRTRFVMQWQQCTGGLMAKGFEDSALYRLLPLASTNDVGAAPYGPRPVSLNGFHRWNEERLAGLPDGMNATSTHDTKRSEDVRARMSVLSEMSGDWSRVVRRWRRMNARHRLGDAPCGNEEWLLYQTLAGAWPLGNGEMASFIERVRSYTIKAARESGERTSWLAPNQRYEDGLSGFIARVLEDSAFLAEFNLWRERLAWYGMLHSLSQVVLKIGSPGVPDFYQGNEFWDFSLVDPDNRRPVDFMERGRVLDSVQKRKERDRPSLVRELRENWPDGHIKLYVTSETLAVRTKMAHVFARGQYLPLYASGWSRKHVVALARKRGRSWALLATSRFVTELSPSCEWPVGGAWKRAKLSLPEGAPQTWTNALTGTQFEATDGSRHALLLSDVFAELPVAVLVT